MKKPSDARAFHRSSEGMMSSALALIDLAAMRLDTYTYSIVVGVTFSHGAGLALLLVRGTTCPASKPPRSWWSCVEPSDEAFHDEIDECTIHWMARCDAPGSTDSTLHDFTHTTHYTARKQHLPAVTPEQAGRTSGTCCVA